MGKAGLLAGYQARERGDRVEMKRCYLVEGAYSLIGDFYDHQGEDEKAQRWYNRGREAGEERALLILAEREPKKAVEYWQLAFQNGSLNAQHALSRYYYRHPSLSGIPFCLATNSLHLLGLILRCYPLEEYLPYLLSAHPDQLDDLQLELRQNYLRELFLLPSSYLQSHLVRDIQNLVMDYLIH